MRQDILDTCLSYVGGRSQQMACTGVGGLLLHAAQDMVWQLRGDLQKAPPVTGCLTALLARIRMQRFATIVLISFINTCH